MCSHFGVNLPLSARSRSAKDEIAANGTSPHLAGSVNQVKRAVLTTQLRWNNIKRDSAFWLSRVAVMETS